MEVLLRYKITMDSCRVPTETPSRNAMLTTFTTLVALKIHTMLTGTYTSHGQFAQQCTWFQKVHTSTATWPRSPSTCLETQKKLWWCLQRRWSQTLTSHCLKSQAECRDPYLDNFHFSSLYLFMLAIQIKCLLFS